MPLIIKYIFTGKIEIAKKIKGAKNNNNISFIELGESMKTDINAILLLKLLKIANAIDEKTARNMEIFIQKKL